LILSNVGVAVRILVAADNTSSETIFSTPPGRQHHAEVLTLPL